MVSHATAGRVSWQRLPPPGGRWQSSGLHGSRCCLVPLEGGGESVSTMTAGPSHAQCMVFAAERTAAIGGHRFSREGGVVRKILRQRRLPRATRRVAKRRPSLQQLRVVHHGATVSTTTAGPASRLLESGGLPGRALVFPCNNGSGIAPPRERQRAGALYDSRCCLVSAGGLVVDGSASTSGKCIGRRRSMVLWQ